MEIQSLGDSILKLNVLELSELRKYLEEKTGVSAAAPMMAMGAMPAAAAAAPAEEQTEFDVVLKDGGPNKIKVIKVVRECTTLGLKEAKALVDGAPGTIKEKVSKEEAEKIKAMLVEAGGVADIK